MPDAKWPGVYVEETGTPHAIAGFDVGRAGFAGLVARVPDGSPAPVTSYAEFAGRYGGVEEQVPGTPLPYLAHAARAFFANGGRSLLVSPVAPAAAPADWQAALDLLREAPIGTVAAPGAGPAADVAGLLCLYAETVGGGRFALIDPPAGLDPAGVRAFREPLECSRAALYYPWLEVPAEEGGAVRLPPSGFVAGLYARVDAERGVFKAPAGEALRLATGLERRLDEPNREMLNPLGIDCIVDFPGRGILVWGARTLSRSVDWRYVSVRRYVGAIEEALREGTRWAVFAPNLPATWSALTAQISTFLHDEWRRGGLTGSRPQEAFAVRCGLGVTMTAEDILAERLCVEVLLAPLRPAEFVALTLEMQVQRA